MTELPPMANDRLNMFCRCIHLWIYAVPAADLWSLGWNLAAKTKGGWTGRQLAEFEGHSHVVEALNHLAKEKYEQGCVSPRNSKPGHQPMQNAWAGILSLSPG